MNIKNNLKKSALIALSATMLMTSVPALASERIEEKYGDGDVCVYFDSKDLADYSPCIEFKSASVNKKSFKKGEKINFKITVDEKRVKEQNKDRADGKSQRLKKFKKMKKVILKLKSEASEQELSVNLKRVKSKNGKAYLSGGLTVTDGMKSGKWCVIEAGIEYYSSDGKVRYNMISNKEYYNISCLSDLSWGNFKVSGTKADLEAPKVTGFKYEGKQKLKRDGYSSWYHIFTWKTSDISKYDTYISYDGRTIGKDKKTGRYIYETSDIGDPFDEYIHSDDKWGNVAGISFGFDGYHNEWSQKLSGSRIELKSITASSDTVKCGNKDKITINMKWKDFKPKKMVLIYGSPYGAATKVVKMTARNSSKTKWSGNFKVDDKNRKGTWRVYKAAVEGVNKKGKTVIIEINNKNVIRSQQPTKEYLKADFKNADIKVK